MELREGERIEGDYLITEGEKVPLKDVEPLMARDAEIQAAFWNLVDAIQGELSERTKWGFAEEWSRRGHFYVGDGGSCIQHYLTFEREERLLELTLCVDREGVVDLGALTIRNKPDGRAQLLLEINVRPRVLVLTTYDENDEVPFDEFLVVGRIADILRAFDLSSGSGV